MSWSVSVPATEQDEASVNAMLDGLQFPSYGGEKPSAEALEQFELAKTIVRAMAASGALGDGPIMGSLGGHANELHAHPNDAAVSGESMYINLSHAQTKRREVESSYAGSAGTAAIPVVEDDEESMLPTMDEAEEATSEDGSTGDESDADPQC
jgi:hypothetical protein